MLAKSIGLYLVIWLVLSAVKRVMEDD